MLPGTEVTVDDLLDAPRKVRVIEARRFRSPKVTRRSVETLIADLTGLLMRATEPDQIDSRLNGHKHHHAYVGINGRHSIAG
jgi:hypothetical protein